MRINIASQTNTIQYNQTFPKYKIVGIWKTALKTVERMENKEFKMGNGHVVTLLPDKKYHYVISVDDVSLLVGLSKESIKEMCAKIMGGKAFILYRRSIDYLPVSLFTELEKTTTYIEHSGIVEQLVKWISAAQFDNLPSSHFDIAFNVDEDVVDLERWEREMLLLLVEVDNGVLRRKLVAKIKEVI